MSKRLEIRKKKKKNKCKKNVRSKNAGKDSLALGNEPCPKLRTIASQTRSS
jgi:hypothetical protein